jgi:hypothetical protein
MYEPGGRFYRGSPRMGQVDKLMIIEHIYDTN